jgi:hypothetical protein
VDVVDWANTAPEFQRHILADSVSLAQLGSMAQAGDLRRV